MENNQINRMPIKAHPYEHQRQAFEFACRLFGLTGHDPPTSRGVALLMEMGTGKSLTTIAVAGRLFLNRKIERLLIVAPLSILGVWQEEFRKFASFPYSLAMIEGIGSRKSEKIRQIPTNGLQVAVINYESAWRLEKELANWDADLIVCDEGHKIKTHNITASKCMHRLGTRARYRMLLTGTIIANKAIDIFSPYKFLNPAVFGNSFYSFRNRYYDMTGYGNHMPVMKANMAEELTRRIHNIAFRATKPECLDLPETTEIVRTVELEPQAKQLYQQLVRDSYAQIKGGEITAANVLTRLLRLSQLTGGFSRGDEADRVERASSAKLDALSDIVDSAAQEGGKLVIIARFLPEIDAITAMLERKGIGYSLITGAVKDRDEQVRRFQTNPDVTVFVGQIATAGLGITLTAADKMVFYSLDYSMSNFEQTKARIHRVGQRNPCTYIYLVADGTVDWKVLKALRDKADLAKALIDDCRGVIIRSTQPERRNMESNDLFALADELRELKKTKKCLEEELKAVGLEIDRVDADLAKRMVDTETQNFTRNGTMFFLTNTTRASAVAERKDELFEALREAGYDDLIYETVNANSLSAFVKEQTTENGDALPQWLDGLVSVFEKTTVGVRKAAR